MSKEIILILIAIAVVCVVCYRFVTTTRSCVDTNNEDTAEDIIEAEDAHHTKDEYEVSIDNTPKGVAEPVLTFMKMYKENPRDFKISGWGDEKYADTYYMGFTLLTDEKGEDIKGYHYPNYYRWYHILLTHVKSGVAINYKVALSDTPQIDAHTLTMTGVFLSDKEKQYLMSEWCDDIIMAVEKQKRAKDEAYCSSLLQKREETLKKLKGEYNGK